MDSTQQRTAGITKSKVQDKSDEPEDTNLTEKLAEYAADICSDDQLRQLSGTAGIRKLLSDPEKPPVEQIDSLKVTPKLIEFMKRNGEPELQLEAAWALCNLSAESTEQTKLICDLGGIPQFVSLLKSPNEQLVEQAIWGLGNIAGESHVYRDEILKQDGAKIIIEILSKTTSKNNLKNGMWALSNLCRGKPKPDLQKVKDVIPFAINILQTETSDELIIDAAWALSSLSELSSNNQNIIPMGAIPLLLKNLESNSVAVMTPCIRTIGSIIAETENQTSMLLNIPEIVPKLFGLLSHNKKAIRREICWILSNITAGTPEQIELVISNHDNIKKLVELAKGDSYEVAKEAIWALSNAFSGCNFPQAMQLYNNGVLEALIHTLSNSNPQVIVVSLEGIEALLKKGQTAAQDEQPNVFVEALDKKGGLYKIEELQNHASEEVYKHAVRILESYFALEE